MQKKIDVHTILIHQKKATLAGLSKLLSVMGSAFTLEIIIQALKDNGQLDLDEGAIRPK